MIDVEFNIIIDRVSSKYGIQIPQYQRVLLVQLFYNINSPGPDENPLFVFDVFVNYLIQKIYYNVKYPGLDLMEITYSNWGQN